MLNASSLWGEEKRVVVITGASRGVGLASAEYLSEKDFVIYGITRNPQMLSYHAKNNLHFLLADLTDQKSIESTIKFILEIEGHIDVLINNAGYAIVGPVESITDKEMQQQMEINFLAPFRFVQAVLPSMRQQRHGHIINISSTNAIRTAPFGGLYSASKAALESFSESLSIEIKPYNISVSIVEPGLLSTYFSILMGTKEIDNNPYQHIIDTIKASIESRMAHPELLSPSQTPKEIAEFLYNIIQDSNPKLRYQTSEESKQDVSKKLLDLSGEKYLNEMLEMLYQEK